MLVFVNNCNVLCLLITHLIKCAVRINSFDLFVLYNVMVLLQDDLIWQILLVVLYHSSRVNQPAHPGSCYAADGEMFGPYESCCRNRPHLFCLDEAWFHLSD